MTEPTKNAIIVSGPDGSEIIDLATASDEVVESWAVIGLPEAINEWLRRRRAARAGGVQ